MTRIKQFAKSLFYLIILLGAFYLLLKKEELSLLYDLPNCFFSSLALFLILYVSIKIIILHQKIINIEYDFSSIINHNFRTPLTRIAWISKELEKEMPSNERLLQLQNLNNANSKLLEIVDIIVGIKNISNTSGYFFEATSLRDIVEKSISKYREQINKKNITFEIASFRNAPLLTVDLKKITFVIDSIIENAIVYTPNHGKVSINYESNNKNLTLIISDNGIGLSLKDKMKVFSKFYRSKRAILFYPDGMGLRLHLSKIIIKRHSGEIYLKSKGINGGTTVFINLPFKK